MPTQLHAGVRWTARAIAAVLVGLTVVIYIGEGGFNPLDLTPVETIQMLFFWVACAGMVAAWRWELVGGAISLAAILAFFAVQFLVTGGFPKGLVIHLILLPGLLFIISSLMRGNKDTRPL
jgi:hypothetical protein